jgi:hypothetical protein
VWDLGACPECYAEWKGCAGFALASVLVSLLLVACSAGPSSDEFNQVIRQHFEARGYRVVELVMGDVDSLGVGEKRYMGTEGYTVRIKRIVVEASGRSGIAVGQAGTGQVSFSNASVSVRENPGQKGAWLITNIQGIAVP